MEKRERAASWLLLFLSVAPFFFFFASIQFLPDQIPAHYNAAGEIDRWGSKYEQLILAVFFSLSGWIIWLISRFSGKLADNDAVIVGIAVQLLLCALHGGRRVWTRRGLFCHCGRSWASGPGSYMW